MRKKILLRNMTDIIYCNIMVVQPGESEIERICPANIELPDQCSCLIQTEVKESMTCNPQHVPDLGGDPMAIFEQQVAMTRNLWVLIDKDD